MKKNILTVSEDHNINYMASIVRLTALEPHPNADKLQIAVIQGQKVITSLEAQIGQFYVYFPIECEISENFLSFCNLFDEADRNKDKTKKGYVHKSGRVRMLKLRNIFSEGLILHVSVLEDYVKQIYKKDLNCAELEGLNFDDILGDKFVRKFVVKLPEENVKKQKSKGSVKKYESKLVPGQFAFHPDTANLKRNVGEVNPEDYISVCNKLHGKNGLCANVLIKRKLSLKEKAAKFFGVKVKDTEYGLLYSSRTVIRNKNFIKKEKEESEDDIWKSVSDRLYPKLDQGVTATYEVFGYDKFGKYIQKGYDYGCSSGELNYAVFNLTYTSNDGTVFTFSHPQLVEYCRKKNIPMPPVYYYGKAKDLFPEISVENHWHENFLDKLCETYLEKDCKICRNPVPDEGICVRIDKPNVWSTLKLKSLRFLSKESAALDAGEVGIEDS